jgi:hypothetical protein
MPRPVVESIMDNETTKQDQQAQSREQINDMQRREQQQRQRTADDAKQDTNERR